MAVPEDDEVLVKAQYRALSRQVPMMYVVLLLSSWIVSLTHIQDAPIWLTVLVPGIFSALAGLRIWRWWRDRGLEITAHQAVTALRGTNLTAFGLALAFSVWGIALFQYGDAYQQSHVAFYMAVTSIFCICSLTHMRSAALIVAAVVMGIFVPFFALGGNKVLVSFALNMSCVSVGLIIMLMINYRNFVQMLRAQWRSDSLGSDNLRLANHDSLTALPNRRAFFNELTLRVEASKADGNRFALGVLDLDGFKPVNDIYGHSSGDRLLVLVGQRLTAILDPDRFMLARIGGDEFAFLTTATTDLDDVEADADKICEALRAPFHLQEAEVLISGSMGLALSGPDAEANTLFDQADFALYAGKQMRRGLSTLFSDALDAQMRREARIEKALRSPDIQNEISLVFQPIIDVRDMRVNSFEALARWNSPELGEISPNEFVPIAERSGVVQSLTVPLLTKALEAAQSWPAPVRLAFNLSPMDFSSAQHVGALIETIANGGFEPANIDLEITESSFAFDFEQLQRSVNQLRELGCGIALDDFGTGYSSLSRLHALPFTQLKIDGSFIQDPDSIEASTKIVRSVLTLGADMGLECVVEGVETAARLSVVREIGSRLVQGYYFSQPVPLERTENILARFGRMEGAGVLRLA